MEFRKYGALVGAVTGTLALLTAAHPIMLSDAPPYANIKRVDDVKLMVKKVGNDIRADLLSGRIFNLRKEECQARERGDPMLANTLANQVEIMRTDYNTLTSSQYQLRPCTEF